MPGLEEGVMVAMTSVPKVSVSTQKRIADQFKKLVCEDPTGRRRVTVTEIVRELGINRKTFYRNFDDTRDLVIWIYRIAVVEMLMSQDFRLAELEYSSSDAQDKYAFLPCYARFRKSGASLAQGKFMNALCTQVFEKDRSYYQTIFTHRVYVDLFRYLVELYIPFFQKDVEIIAGDGKDLDQVTIDFLAEYHVMGVFGRLDHYYTYTKGDLLPQNIDQFWNYSHEMIEKWVRELC